ncbi:MAG: 27 kDa outer membrane protein [Gammaproteobacteria bacterium]|jgi:protein-disulfide isomerase|nr:27 kDa outer membrane protein [Gammaproteobacteria bacterium]
MKKTLSFILFSFASLLLAACHNQPLQTISVPQDQVVKLYGDTDGAFIGKADAPITMVEIYSYDCRYCREDAALIEQFAKDHPNVRIVFKPFMAFGEHTRTLPQYAALAAGRQGAFAPMHRELMSTHRVMSLKNIHYFARHLKLDMGKFNAALKDPTIAKRIQENTALMDALNIDAIPTVIVTQTRLLKDPSLTGQIPQYVQVGFLSNDLLVHLVDQVAKDGKIE